MKTKVFLLTVMIFPIVAIGQINQKNVTEVKVTPPSFTGIQKFIVEPENGQNDPLEVYFSDHFKYPEFALECMMQGTAVVQFNVTPSGELSNFEIINSVCREVDEELIRVLKTTSGMWKPGLNNMKPVDMEKEISIMLVASQKIKNKNNPKAYFIKLARNHFIKANILFLERHNLKKALKNYDQTIKYLPYDAPSLLVRGLCRYELGDLEGARNDWERINRIGSFDASSYLDELASLKGYDEMSVTLEK